MNRQHRKRREGTDQWKKPDGTRGKRRKGVTVRNRWDGRQECGGEGAGMRNRRDGRRGKERVRVMNRWEAAWEGWNQGHE
jgi:hypothetical protein